MKPISIGLDFKYAKRLEITKNASRPYSINNCVGESSISIISFLIFIKHPFFPVVTIKTFDFGRFCELVKVA